MKKENFLNFSKKIIKILMLVQVMICSIFVIKNIGYIPKYGDTAEFLELSKTLDLPSYRPFIYPVTLNIMGKIANLLNLNIVNLTYVLQMIVNLFACAVAIGTIKEVFKIKLSKKEFVLYTLFIFTIPFNMHFNMSIKCDSLATSFTILFICYLIKYMKTEKYKFAIYSFITMFLTCNTRSEKLYFLAFVIVSTIIIDAIIYFYNRKKEKLNIKKIAILFVILVLSVMSTNIAKGIFTSEDDNTDTSESTIFLYMYERIVADTLPNIYEYLPDDIKQTISYEDAVATTVNGNTYKLPYLTLLEQDGNLERANKILKVAIRRNFPKIAINITSDFLKNIFSPYYIIFDTEDEMYEYTVEKMEGEHYLFADAYILYFNIVFIIMNIYVIVSKMGERLKIQKEILIPILYTIVSSCFFSLLTGFNFHIRYIMPIYILEIVIITVLLNRTKRQIAGKGENK